MNQPKRQQTLPDLKPTASGDALYRALGQAARLLYRLLMSVRIEGKENLPQEGGYIIVSNHLSEIDPITVAYPSFISGTLPRFLAKESLFHAPVLGFILRKLAHVPVARGSIDARKSLRTAQNIIEAGGAVVIYPEGTLTQDPDLWPMQGRTGAARLALATGAPLVPIAHWGDHEFLPARTAKPRIWPRKKVTIRVGKPLDLSAYRSEQSEQESGPASRDQLAALTEHMLQEITKLLADIRGQQPPASLYNPATGKRQEPGE